MVLETLEALEALRFNNAKQTLQERTELPISYLEDTIIASSDPSKTNMWMSFYPLQSMYHLLGVHHNTRFATRVSRRCRFTSLLSFRASRQAPKVVLPQLNQLFVIHARPRQDHIVGCEMPGSVLFWRTLEGVLSRGWKASYIGHGRRLV